MTLFNDYLYKVEQGLVLSEQEMIIVMGYIFEGTVPEPQLVSLLDHMADRRETDGEIAGAARVLRGLALTINAPENTVDCCGTGGDGLGTYNISTAVALVSAACGVPVAKHGNRAASSRSGAADVLEHLGVHLTLPRDKLELALREIGFCFLMAPHHHLAMRHVHAARQTLKRRTIFNLIGPLSNPAGTRRQLIGVSDKKWILPMARALQKLGSDRAWVVHGDDGLDEISLSGPTAVAILDDGTIREHIFTPADFGLSPIDNRDITGGDVAQNATALLALLNGEKNAYRQIVLANAAAVLMVADIVPTLMDGVHYAATAIDTGKALNTFDRYRALS